MTGAEPFVLCADDYGFAPGVSAGIRELLAAKRLSATSCLVASPHWQAEAPALRALDVDADIGLHLALTQVAPLGPMPGLAPSGTLPMPGKLTMLAYACRLDRGEIGREIDRQLDAFEQAMGRPPDYVDGHHHVQQLPAVRDALIERFRTRLPRGTALRVCHEPLHGILARGVSPLRATVISFVGRGLRRAADRAGIPGNRRFSGVRGFTETAPYRDLFRRFIRGGPPGLAVMCHPGYPDDALRALDHVVDQRTGEQEYLMSDAFLADIAEAGLRLGRFRELAGRLRAGR
ncbi:MAG: ChbG/HpnK family deacetylase [Alphaproteobacteria bacterium]|nr:ChbG/HpnK family deacetylase [Alphaproteobacteria bacterium]